MAKWLFTAMIFLASASILAQTLEEQNAAAKDQFRKGQYQQAVETWQSLKQQGFVEASHNLGVAYANGLGLQQNQQTAFELFSSAYQQGFQRSSLNLGIMYFEGKAVEQDLPKALEFFTQGIAVDPGKAHSYLGRLHYSGQLPSPPADPGKGAEHFRLSAEADFGYGLYRYGMLKLEGDEVKRDTEGGFELLMRAADKSVAEANFELYQRFYQGNKAPVDNVLAAQYLQRAAELGHARAQYSLGGNYLTGKLVKADPKLAAQWFYEAAKQGHLSATYYYATALIDGKGIEPNIAQGIDLLEKLSQRKHANAQYLLGAYYQKGQHVPQDHHKAFAYYLAAAGQGHQEAAKQTGFAYALGEGVKEDPEAAYLWFSQLGDKASPFIRYLMGKSAKAMSKPDKAFQHYKAAAEAKMYLAYYPLALAYQEGMGTPKYKSQYFYWLKQAAESSENSERGDIQSDLAFAYKKGIGAAVNQAQYLHWVKKAVANNDATAIYNYAISLHDGEVGAPNIPEAIRLFKQVCADETLTTSGRKSAARWLSNIYGRELRAADFKDKIALKNALYWTEVAYKWGDQESGKALKILRKIKL